MLTAVLIGFISTQNFAQQTLENNLGTWYVLSGNAQLNEKWSLPFCGILREYNLASATEFGFVQAGIGYQITPTTKLSVGLAFLDKNPFESSFDEGDTNQFWLYHELKYKSSKKFTHRLRVENRWFINTDETYLKSRIRYRLQYTYTLTNSSYLKVFEEPFLGLQEAHINQNRFYLGYGRKLNQQMKLELGYLKLHVGKNNFDRIRMTLLINTNLFSPKNHLFANR